MLQPVLEDLEVHGFSTLRVSRRLEHPTKPANHLDPKAGENVCMNINTYLQYIGMYIQCLLINIKGNFTLVLGYGSLGLQSQEVRIISSISYKSQMKDPLICSELPKK